MIIHTCKDCPDRHLGCHSKCKKYNDEKAQNDSEMEGYRRWKEAKYFAVKEKDRPRRRKRNND